MTGGLLAGLSETSRIMQATGCSWDEAHAEWQKTLPASERPSNVIDFAEYRRSGETE